MSDLFGRRGKVKEQIVPELGKENRDKDAAIMIVDVVVTIVKCVANVRCDDEGSVIDMVVDIEPWLIDADSYDKLHRMLVKNLIKLGWRICSSLLSRCEGQLSCSLGLLTRVH
ncbi:Peptidase C50, separase [Artemisia annua]|uniref:Peptidase C50, separase n=1 Tax=Artemisia annua TaxID=35608 RepID=A0A2U1NHG5_ARTAN|nr:Peptidase C50, separase [Artemisia annua]